MYKCKWCKDSGMYYPLHGPAEPCRECAAFTTQQRAVGFGHDEFALKARQFGGTWHVKSVSLEEFKAEYPTPPTLFVRNISVAESNRIRENVPYSAQGYDIRNNTAYIATWPKHAPRIMELLGWNALNTAMHTSGCNWIMEHKPRTDINPNG